MHSRDLMERLRFDYKILNEMRCPTFDFEAYRTTGDLQSRRNQITDTSKAQDAHKYRFILRVPTLIGPNGRMAPVTEIGVDVDVVDYPRGMPNTWIISRDVPWSPHFLVGAPVCIGTEFWTAREGHVTLGNLAIHLQRLLNWDEKGRGQGYVGYNGEAIKYHLLVYNGKPLDPNLIYANLPNWLFGGRQSELVFEIGHRPPPTSDFEILR